MRVTLIESQPRSRLAWITGKRVCQELRSIEALFWKKLNQLLHKLFGRRQQFQMGAYVAKRKGKPSELRFAVSDPQEAQRVMTYLDQWR